MLMKSLPFESISQFSNRDIDYQSQNADLMQLVSFAPTLDGIKCAMAERKRFPVDRELIKTEIERQYSNIPFSKSQKENVNRIIDENSFTVITAHQPSLFTGPLYFLLKIASTINLARKLNESGENFIIPVFILGGEDHDFEEINHTFLFQNKISWNRKSQGPVGRLSLENLEASGMKQLFEILGDSTNAKELQTIISDAYAKARNYGEFTFHLVNQLFAKEGLLIFSFDNFAFKKAFIPIIKKEILEQFSKEYVEDTQRLIEETGYNKQAHAREINFFYFVDGKRLRVIKNDENYEILDSDLKFTEQEMIKEIESHPERFSPNVIIRPLYQEYILPNVAYIGGGGELAYWMERKSLFDALEIFYPALIRRTSAMYINKRQQKTLKELDISLKDLTNDTHALIKDFVTSNSSTDISLQNSKAELEKIYSGIKDKAISIDGSLGGKVDAMLAQQLKSLDKLEDRLVKSLKTKEEVNINKIRKIKDQLFPENGLQERRANFMELYLREGDSLIGDLIEFCNPLDNQFAIFLEE